jgi:hypothetical protein
MSSTVGTGYLAGACRIAGIISSVNAGPPASAMAVIAGSNSGSNGGGGPTRTAPGSPDSSAVEIPVITASSSAATDTADTQRGRHDEISYRRARSILR